MKEIILEDKHIRGALSKLNLEDFKQIEKWGHQKHSPFEWLAYTIEELGELSNAISEYVYRKGSIDDIIKEAVQTATLSLKIAQMFMDYKKSNPTHKG